MDNFCVSKLIKSAYEDLHYTYVHFIVKERKSEMTLCLEGKLTTNSPIGLRDRLRRVIIIFDKGSLLNYIYCII